MTIFVRLTVFLPIVSRMLLLEPRILVAKPAPRGGWPTLILKQSNLKQTELVFRLCGLLTTRIPSNRRSPMTAAATCIAIPQDPRKLMKQIECVARVRMLTTMIIERCGASIGTTPTRPLPCRTCNRQPLMIWCVVILKKLGYFEGPTRRIRAIEPRDIKLQAMCGTSHRWCLSCRRRRRRLRWLLICFELCHPLQEIIYLRVHC